MPNSTPAYLPATPPRVYLAAGTPPRIFTAPLPLAFVHLVAVLRRYLRADGSSSAFFEMWECWWWCLQTLTSLGYGTPWAPLSLPGQVIAIATALVGTVRAPSPDLTSRTRETRRSRAFTT